MPDRSKSKTVTTYVAFLRAINVGGNNMVSMADLRASFEALGFTDVSSYINSGNILFRAKEKDARKLEKKIDRMMESEHDIPARTVVRSHAEMAELVRTIDRTWRKPSADWRYNVAFLRHEVDGEDVLAGIDAQPGVEEVVYCPGTLLWSASVKDIKRTSMDKLSRLPINRDMTVRNLNTTRKMLALMDAMEKE